MFFFNVFQMVDKRLGIWFLISKIFSPIVYLGLKESVKGLSTLLFYITSVIKLDC